MQAMVTTGQKIELPAGWRMAGVLTNALGAISIAIAGFIATQGVQMWSEIHSLRKDMAALEAKVEMFPREIPPQWFIDRVNRLEVKIDRINDKFAEISGYNNK